MSLQSSVHEKGLLAPNGNHHLFLVNQKRQKPNLRYLKNTDVVSVYKDM